MQFHVISVQRWQYIRLVPLKPLSYLLNDVEDSVVFLGLLVLIFLIYFHAVEMRESLLKIISFKNHKR